MSMIPVVASVGELPGAVTFGQTHPAARWYVAKRAETLGRPDLIPEEWGVTAATMSQAARDKLAKSGAALPDGSFPITDRAALSRAVRAFGRAKNKAAAKKHIIKRATALHSKDLLPDTWTPKTAAAVEADDAVAVWADEVRELITAAGGDAAEVEADTDGFAADFEQYRDVPELYAAEVLEAHSPGDDTTETAETAIMDTETSEIEGGDAVLAELVVAPQLPQNVTVYASPPALTPEQLDAVAAAVVAKLTAAGAPHMMVAPVPEPAPAAAAPATQPVDVDALRAKFNGKKKPAKKTPPDVPPPLAASRMTPAVMRAAVEAARGR